MPVMTKGTCACSRYYSLNTVVFIYAHVSVYFTEDTYIGVYNTCTLIVRISVQRHAKCFLCVYCNYCTIYNLRHMSMSGAKLPITLKCT